jgi:very-short-patch-repair endonuclease
MTTTIMGPFLGTEALAAGSVTRRQLGRRYRAVYRNVYVPAGQELTAVTRAKAAWLWARRNAVAAGLSASALHGSRWIDADEPAELMRIGDAAPGILIYRDKLGDDEICVRAGIPATTTARTAFDLGRRGPLVAAVQRLDALANATGLTRREVDPLLERHRGARGIVQLRRAIGLMDGGAESPPETSVRLMLIAGFPRPETQIVVVDGYGKFVGRVDTGYREFKVGVEYDGPQHWTDPRQHARDIDRLAELAAQGWVIVRVSRDILRYRRDVALRRTRDAMRAAGWPHWAQVRVDTRISLERGA